MLKMVRMLAAVSLAACAGASQAQSYWQYSFGTWLGGEPSYQPGETFAALSVSTYDQRNFTFMLSAFNPDGPGTLASAFSPNAYISKVVFNTASGAAPIGISNIQTNGYVANVSLASHELYIHSVGFDFYDCINNCAFGSSATLQSGEMISWQVEFAEVQLPLFGAPAVALNIHNWNQHGGINSGWYTPNFQTAPVPEPETFAMMLAGLGLMGFVARRRHRHLSAA